MKLWNEGRDPQHTIVEDYLRSRSLDLPPELAGTCCAFIRAARGVTRDTGQTVRIPAMLAAFRSIDDDQITGIHRIRLDQPQRWPKAERRDARPGAPRRCQARSDRRHNAVHRRGRRDMPWLRARWG